MAAPKVHVYTSAPEAFFVNSFVIEGSRSLVLVDTQFVLSEANALVSRIAELEKPLAAVFITHPHPDHYNGLATVLAKFPSVPVHATASTIQGMHETAESKRDYWTPLIGANYPQSFAYPDTVVTDGQSLIIDGIELHIFDFGPAECSDNTAIALPGIDAAIISDLVYNRVHPWLTEGRAYLWLQALEKARARLAGAAAVYPGHGAPGGPGLMAEQAAYIVTLQNLVAEAAGNGRTLPDQVKLALREKIVGLYPNWPLEAVVEMGLDGLRPNSGADG